MALAGESFCIGRTVGSISLPELSTSVFTYVMIFMPSFTKVYFMNSNNILV